MARGQFILEFMILIALAIIVGTMYVALSTQLLADTSEDQRVRALNDVAFMIQDELILAESVDDGYMRNISVPDKADRFAYTLSYTTNSLELRSGNTILTYSLPPFNGSLQKGTNVIRRNGVLTVMSS
jgi:hypothetical protein